MHFKGREPEENKRAGNKGQRGERAPMLTGQTSSNVCAVSSAFFLRTRRSAAFLQCSGLMRESSRRREGRRMKSGVMACPEGRDSSYRDDTQEGIPPKAPILESKMKQNL